MRHVAAFLIGRGLDAARLFSSAGLDIDDTLDAEARFPARQVDLLWHLSSVQANDPFIALQPGPMQPPSAFDTLAYAMMSCETLGDAVDRLLHYCTAVSDAVDLRCDRHDPGATIQVHPTEPDVPGRSLRLDYTLVTFLHFCRWLTGQPVTPLAVALPYPAPANLDVHGSAFKVTPEFSRPFHALTLSTSDLSAPLPTANARLAHMHQSVVEQRISELQPSAFEQALLVSVIRRIAAGPVRRSAVAQDLFLSDRTLQRRLSEHGLSFKNVLDEARKKMALKYLHDAAIPIAMVGELLGFSESSTLYRASQRWFGATPKDVRRQALDRARGARP